MWSNFIRFMMFSQFSPLSVSKPDGTEQIIQKNEPSFVPLFLQNKNTPYSGIPSRQLGD